MRWLALLLLIPIPALAQTWTGVPRVVDGDTIAISGTRLRLLSMDAFETTQACQRDGQRYSCGAEATRALVGLIGQQEVRCKGDRQDRYGRPLVHCWIGELDLGREMVRLGWAVADYGTEYIGDQEIAQASRSGARAGTFELPRDCRREHPR